MSAKNDFHVRQSKQSLPTRGIQNSTANWRSQKTTRDEQLWKNYSHHWICQNKLYDLSRYVDKHPGGKHWLTMTKGQDITQHFITHHLNEDKARAVLDKYYVGDVAVPQQSRFTFQEGGLYRNTKKKLLRLYSLEQLQNSSKSEKNGIFFITMFVIAFLLTGYLQSFFMAVVSGLLIFPILGVAHNFLHMRDHPFRFLWLLTGFTHKEWQQMHCISHHSYANTLIDYQIQALEPLIYYLKISPKNRMINWFFKQITLMLLTPLNILLKVIVTPITLRVQPEWFYLVPLIQLPLLWLMTQNFYLAFKLFLTIHISISTLFAKLTFLGHRTGYEWTEGNEQIRDFGEHQVYASSDTQTDKCRGFWSYMLYAGFNYHAAHHMFPTIDNHSLPQATVVLEEEASKLGIKLNKIKGVLWALLEIEKNFFKRKEWSKQQ